MCKVIGQSELEFLYYKQNSAVVWSLDHPVY